VITNLDQLAERPAGPLRWHASMPAAAYLASIRRAGLVALPLLDQGRASGQLSCALPMRLGKAIVASRLPSMAGHIEDGLTGLSVPVGDATALAEAMRRLRGDERLRARLGESPARGSRSCPRPPNRPSGASWPGCVPSYS